MSEYFELIWEVGRIIAETGGGDIIFNWNERVFLNRFCLKRKNLLLFFYFPVMPKQGLGWYYKEFPNDQLLNDPYDLEA